jgi:hypothetical protein
MPFSSPPPHSPRSGHPATAAAAALLHASGLPAPRATDDPSSRALNLDVAGGPWPLPDALSASRPPAWMFAQISADGTGDLRASHPAHLYALAALLADGHLSDRADALAEGLLLEVTFPTHRPLYDQVLTQVARTARRFDPEAYVAQLARSGFTHLEVNGLATHIPFEPGVPTEFYNQFYTYCPGLNHFVGSPLTRGLYPAEYLQANLNRVRKLAALGRRYGLQPGLLCFEPRSLPEHFFQRHPTLRGARIDHPFRSHLPRYTLAQDHPVAQEHYRQMMRAMVEAVPDLDYLSVWTNDSGAGFEHTSSLYVGRNGGPYMIREWREHDQIAETAGQGVLRWLRMMQEAAAELNPDFEVSIRVEHFKVEHETIFAGMGEGLTIEAPSLLVRGYELPYTHPEYPEQASAAGSIYHLEMDEREGMLLEEHRAQGFEPRVHYAAGAGFNLEPLLGIPFPRMLYAKLSALRETGFRSVSAIGGLMNTPQTPYWPNPEIIRAVQFTPETPVDDVLDRIARKWVGDEHADALVAAWDAVEEGLRFMPIVPLFSNLGFVWYRMWIRPFVPNLEAVPEEDRLYYERFMVTVPNNPNNVDLARDVLFELVTEESGRRMAAEYDEHALPRLRTAAERLTDLARNTEGTNAGAVFADLRDRARALLYWATTQRNTCAWVAGVHGFLGAGSDDERAEHRAYVQEMIDLDLENTRALLDLWETSDTEFIVVSDVSETSFVYGENIGDHLRRKLDLTERYRDADPYIDPNILWRLTE